MHNRCATQRSRPTSSKAKSSQTRRAFGAFGVNAHHLRQHPAPPPDTCSPTHTPYTCSPTRARVTPGLPATGGRHDGLHTCSTHLSQCRPDCAHQTVPHCPKPCLGVGRLVCLQGHTRTQAGVLRACAHAGHAATSHSPAWDTAMRHRVSSVTPTSRTRRHRDGGPRAFMHVVRPG